MRIGASSGNMVGVGSAGAGCVVGLLMYLGWLPVSSGVVLLITALLISSGAFIGAWRAHYHPEQRTDGADKRRPHNLICVGTEVRRIFFVEGGAIASQPIDERDTGRDATVAVYSNRPVKGMSLSAVRNVRATIAPVSPSAQIPGGWWLDEGDNTADFEPGDAVRELLLVYRDDDGSIWAVEDRREGISRNLPPRHFSIFQAPHMMGALSVRVQLSARGHIVNDCSFSVDIGDKYEFGADIVRQEQFQLASTDGKVIDADPNQARTRLMEAHLKRRRATPEKQE